MSFSATKSLFQSRLLPKAPTAAAIHNNNNITTKGMLPSGEKSPPGAGPGPGLCICSRPRQTVICRECGSRAEGRVRRVCPAHPAQIYLLDLAACPACKTQNLASLEEWNCDRRKLPELNHVGQAKKRQKMTEESESMNF